MGEVHYSHEELHDRYKCLSVFDTIPEYYLILDVDFCILRVSNASLSILEMDRASLSGAYFSRFFKGWSADHGILVSRLEATLRLALTTGSQQTINLDAHIQMQGDQRFLTREWHCLVTPIPDVEKNLDYLILKLVVSPVAGVDPASPPMDQYHLEANVLLRQAEIAGHTGSYEGDLQTLDYRFSDGLFLLLGYEPGSFAPTLDFIESITHPEDVLKIRDIVTEAVSLKQPYRYVRRVYTRQGELRYMLAKGSVVCEEGIPVRLLGVVHDTTEKKKADQKLAEANDELRQNKELLQSVFDSTMIGISVLTAVRDPEGVITDFRIQLVSKELERETGRDDLVGKLYGQEYPGIRESGLFKMMLQVMENGVAQSTEYHYPYDGFDKWFSCTFVRMGDGLVASNLDVTAAREADARIAELKTLQQKQLFESTIMVQEDERKRISESLRNGIGQLLYAVKVNMEQIDAEQTPDGFTAKRKANGILDEAIREVRRISHEMTPAALEDFGLVSSIRDLCSQFSPALRISSFFEGMEDKLNGYLEVSIYRIVQELIVNTVRHADATVARIEVQQLDSDIKICVMDNGRGFDVDSSRKKGMGLPAIYNKVHLLNGTLTIDTAKGTRVVITIPKQSASRA